MPKTINKSQSNGRDAKGQAKSSPKLTRTAAIRVIAEYREFDAFKASSLTRGGKRVMR